VVVVVVERWARVEGEVGVMLSLKGDQGGEEEATSNGGWGGDGA